MGCTKKRCSDGKQNQVEENVDCGGKCDPCLTCNDELLNNEEEKVDCGGPNCSACPPEWVKIASQTTETLRAVQFIEETGFAVGDNGTILKSVDFGDSWTKITSPASVNLNAVQVFSKTNIFIAGEDDHVLVSTDGNSFTISKTGEKSGWKDVHFIHPDTGVVGGHPTRMCYTTNGGKTWITPAEWPASKSGIDAIHFYTNKIGYAIGGFRLLETLDGGRIWTDRGTSNNQSDFENFGDLHYMATNRVFMTKSDGLYFSTNSLDWTNKLLKCSKGKFHFVNNLGLYAGATSDGLKGKAMYTDDNGVSWTTLSDAPSSNIFQDGRVFNSTNLLLVGDAGVIYKRK